MSLSDRERQVARFVLDAATAAGVKVGTDGEFLDAYYPRGLPRDVWAQLSRAFSEHREALIAYIQEENGVR